MMPGLCENCHQHPGVTYVTLGDEPAFLCEECIAEILPVLEDEAIEEQFVCGVSKTSPPSAKSSRSAGRDHPLSHDLFFWVVQPHT